MQHHANECRRYDLRQMRCCLAPLGHPQPLTCSPPQSTPQPHLLNDTTTQTICVDRSNTLPTGQSYMPSCASTIAMPHIIVAPVTSVLTSVTSAVTLDMLVHPAALISHLYQSHVPVTCTSHKTPCPHISSSLEHSPMQTHTMPVDQLYIHAMYQHIACPCEFL